MREAAVLWMSEPRLETYLVPCGDDLALAMDLYDWNLRLAQATLHDVALFEVALRNAYDRCLKDGWEGDWLLDDESPVRRPIMRTNRRGNVRDQNRINRRSIDELAGARKSHDWIVSNLTLGFWTHMTDRSHERDLWIPHLHRAWPSGASRADVASKVSTINRVRNRAMHHEHLFNPTHDGASVTLACVYMEEIFAHLVPQEFRTAHPEMAPNDIRTFLGENPAPAEVAL